MRPEDAHLLTPGTKVVIKNDFYKHPINALEKYLGTTMTVRTVREGCKDCMVYMEESPSAQFYIQEIDYVAGVIDYGDEEYQAADLAELFA